MHPCARLAPLLLLKRHRNVCLVAMPALFLAGSLGLGDDAARSDGLAIEDELAEAIEARKRAAATTPATSKARAAIAALRRVLQYCAREGLSVALENCVLGASTLLAHPERDAEMLLHDTLM